MKHETYIARKRARFKAGCGENVNIPYGTALTVQGGFLVWRNKLMCADTSQVAYDYFSQNDDGRGKERGELVSAILLRLKKNTNKPDPRYQERWNRIWDDPFCQQFKRPEHEDHWIWNYEFYNAKVEDLQYIFRLISA